MSNLCLIGNASKPAKTNFGPRVGMCIQKLFILNSKKKRLGQKFQKHYKLKLNIDGSNKNAGRLNV